MTPPTASPHPVPLRLSLATRWHEMPEIRVSNLPESQPGAAAGLPAVPVPFVPLLGASGRERLPELWDVVPIVTKVEQGAGMV